MKEKTRNVLVGLTVLVALAILGALILMFHELPTFVRVGYIHKARFPNASGAEEGSDVLLAGRRIGRVTHVEFTEGDARKGVTFTLLIKSGVNVPGDVNAYIRTRGLAGRAYIDLISDGRPPGAGRVDPATGKPLRWLPKDRVVLIEGEVYDTGLIPRDMRAEIHETLAELRTLAKALNEFLAPTTATAPAGAPQAPTNVRATLAKLDAALEAISQTLGDKENQANIKEGLANFKAATKAAAKALEGTRELFAEARKTFADARKAFAEVGTAAGVTSRRFDDLAARLIDDADRMGKVLTSLHRSAERLESGKGTAGKLINDPKLYEEMVEVTAQLKETLQTLQSLLERWKEQGIKLNLK